MSAALGSSGATIGASNPPITMTPTRNSPMTARAFRRRTTTLLANHDRRAGSPPRAIAGAVITFTRPVLRNRVATLGQLDPWVEDAVEHVDDKVDQDEPGGEDDHT